MRAMVISVLRVYEFIITLESRAEALSSCEILRSRRDTVVKKSVFLLSLSLEYNAVSLRR